MMSMKNTQYKIKKYVFNNSHHYVHQCCDKFHIVHGMCKSGGKISKIHFSNLFHLYSNKFDIVYALIICIEIYTNIQYNLLLTHVWSFNYFKSKTNNNMLLYIIFFNHVNAKDRVMITICFSSNFSIMFGFKHSVYCYILK